MMASKADLHDDDDIGSPDGQGEVEDGEREDDSSDSGDGEVNSHSENENAEADGGGEQPIDDDSEESTEEFIRSEPKSSSSASNMSNDHVISADDIDSDEDHIEKISSSAPQSEKSPKRCAVGGGVISTSVRGEESFGASSATSVDTVGALSKEGVRKPIRIEYSDDLSASSEAVIRSPSLERESDVNSPPLSKLTSTSNKSQEVNPESPSSIMGVSEPEKSVGNPTTCAVPPNPPTSFVGPESAINSPSVGFESLSPQSLGEDDEYPQANRPTGDHGNNVDALKSSNASQAPMKSLPPNQSLEDQEGELDFEEETPEERREATAEVVSKHRKITMSSTENTSSSKKVLLKVEKIEDKEEGEEGEDGEDDGEVEDDDDLEEGEVKESTSIRKVQPKPICRFYSKGQCTWGSACRFLHPGINDKGNYNMFAPAKSLVPNNNVAPASSPYIWPARPPAVSPTFGTRGYVEPIPLPLPPPPPPAHFDEPVRESAWERGLRHAKEILRKSTKRKETEPDFEEKRMNLGVSNSEVVEYEKENDYYNRSSPYPHIATATDSYSAAYSYDDVALDPFERQAHDYWRGGNYENFEVRYTRSDYQYRLDRSRLKDRELDHRDVRNRERDLYREPPSQSGDRGRIGEDRSRREKFDSRVIQHSPERSRRDDRYTEHSSAPRSSRGERGDEWCDPWRRSTSPKRHKLSRSFSSRSSMSYSSSGHSSGSRSSSYSSHSRSSSGSSNSSFSSRSYSPTQAVHQHHPHHQRHQSHQSHHPVQHAKPAPRERSTKLPPAAVDHMAGEVHRRPKPLPPGGHIPAQISSGTRPPVDKRPTTQKQASAVAAQPQPSCDRKRPLKLPVAAPAKSSRSGSSHSRSSSGSSLVSVSSKSSASSKSSFNSGRNMSTLDALKREERRVRERERMRTVEMPRRPPGIASGSAPDRERIGNVRGPRDVRGGESQADLRVKSLVNASRTSKDPLRQAGQKPQIKLTLLNKAQPAEKTIAAPPPVKKQVADVRKQKAVVVVPDKETLSRPVKVAGSTMMSNSRKRPLPASPSGGALDAPSSMAKVLSSAASRNAMTTSKPPQVSAAAAALLNKKSTSSRREELLKQLKAVEDAIARKRAKFTGPSSRGLEEC